MTVKTKTKTKTKSVKGHARNPNYKGKHFKTPEYVKKIEHVNKYKEFLKSPLKQLEDREKEIKSLIKVNSIAKVIKSPIHPDTSKFTKWVKSLENPVSRKLLFVLPIILFRIASLIVKNQDIYKQVISIYDEAAGNLDWKDRWLPSKIYKVMYDFFNFLYEKGVRSLPELIVITGIFIDDLPRIFTSKDYNELQDLSILELGKQAGRKVMQVQTIAETATEKKNNDLMQKESIRTLDETLTELRNTKDLLTTSNEVNKKVSDELGRLGISSDSPPIESIKGTKFTFAKSIRTVNIKRGEKRTAEQ